MWATKTVEKIRQHADLCDRKLLTLDDINEMENTVLEYDQQISEVREQNEEILKNIAQVFNDKVSSHIRASSLELQELEAQLLKLKAEHEEISQKICQAEVIFEKNEKEKQFEDEAMQSLQTEKDVISAFKLATLSHFSYGKKIKYGYFLDKKSLRTKTFASDFEKDSSEASVDERWKNLKSFIGTPKRAK